MTVSDSSDYSIPFARKSVTRGSPVLQPNEGRRTSAASAQPHIKLQISCPINERDLLISTRQFAHERRLRSWMELSVTMIALTIVVIAGVLSRNILTSLCVSVILALLFVRVFAIYHDYMHSSIFKNSRVGGFILKGMGMYLLTPPSVWKRSHDHHHKHNSKLFGLAIGTFALMTVSNYRKASFLKRLEYRFSRSFLVMMSGYVFVFLWGMCLAPLFISPRKHMDCVFSLILHYGIGICVFALMGWNGLTFLFALPFVIATAMGAYLFYVQHNFPGAQLEEVNSWSHTYAALASTSYLDCGPIMAWFTANIGYHHVHHLNAKIPFYRLPETHAALPEVQIAPRTTLKIPHVVSSLRVNLWHEGLSRFVSFADSESLDEYVTNEIPSLSIYKGMSDDCSSDESLLRLRDPDSGCSKEVS